ncbi:diguanylate cyclase [Rubrobacter xylanophilus DSM 9941]|uniref:Diguanylate cyclase n=1 Tax=Rubrobacter xylanophilus (strain DSM 9941 / JCM 11954 / NBRC 16129 / PRD-1) TaxID=266117 RepID=Q1AWN1_RUBXD|nr:diguanylate cyclase [Rubrobacter xylanophilus]ABG04197.1 diguanylate cyclase [Rubrobacter xylanophilus DSM 9941]
MASQSLIADSIGEDLRSIVAGWREERGGAPDREREEALAAGMEELVVAFTEFLRSPEPVETFTRGGATRALVGRIARYQRGLGRDAVGVIEDFMALRRCVWRAVERRVDLGRLSGGEVARFFVKLMQASDWVTEKGLEAFDALVREEMEQELGRAQATDLVTGLPDRDLFHRVLLPRAVAEHRRLALVVFDVANFTETVARGRVEDARRILYRLSEAVREESPEGAVCARFGDDEICAVLPETGGEAAYQMAERVLRRLAAEHGGFEVDAGVAEYPAHASRPGELVSETLRALGTAKRLGGSGIVVARRQ